MSRDGPLVYRLDVLSCMVAVSAVASGNGREIMGRLVPVLNKKGARSAHLTMALSDMTRRRFRQLISALMYR
ncbi:MAG: hypothetical protein HF981_06370 [Desulfobacteraceae bacterium]|nr:hypothetical protein [Desulfobacteraceae bacterium]MBC2749995.1 hypothetical protein [Desulfobacteraceae bacterium]